MIMTFWWGYYKKGQQSQTPEIMKDDFKNIAWIICVFAVINNVDVKERYKV